MKKCNNKFYIIIPAILIALFTAMFTSSSFVSAHSLNAWSNKYPANKAGGDYQFGIYGADHIDGNNVNYYWNNSTAKSYFSSAMTDALSSWG